MWCRHQKEKERTTFQRQKASNARSKTAEPIAHLFIESYSNLKYFHTTDCGELQATLIPVMAVAQVILNNEITRKLSSALDTSVLILAADRCLIKETTYSFAWENLPVINREQHTEAPSDLQAPSNNTVRLCSYVSLHPCLKTGSPRCGLSCPYLCLLSPQDFLNTLCIRIQLNWTWRSRSVQVVAANHLVRSPLAVRIHCYCWKYWRVL